MPSGQQSVHRRGLHLSESHSIQPSTVHRDTWAFIGNFGSYPRHSPGGRPHCGVESEIVLRASPEGSRVDENWIARDARLASRFQPWPPPQVSTFHPAAIQMPDTGYFPLHLVSHATGETLITVARAAAAQYANVAPVEHLYPMVRSRKQLDHCLAEITESPGLVLYTLLEEDLIQSLENTCRELGLPCMSVLGPILRLFQSYLGAETIHRAGAQHVLNAEYFQRIDALNYSMIHDDGQHVEGLAEADVVLIGVSRTSKTPTSIYLANRGVRTANVPLVPGIALPLQLETLKKPLVVSLHATPERLIQGRQNRLLSMGGGPGNDDYIDRQVVADEVAFARKLCIKFNWAQLYVTRRSIEESAAAVLKLFA